MKLTISSPKKWDFSRPCGICVLTDEKSALGNPFNKPALDGKIQDKINGLSSKTFTAQMEVLNHESSVIFIIPLPKKAGLDRNERIRLAAATALGALKERAIKKAFFPLEKTKQVEFQAVLEGFMYSSYEFSKYKSKRKKAKPPDLVLTVGGTKIKEYNALHRETRVMFQGIDFCRDLVNEPAHALPPGKLAAEANKRGRALGVKVSIKKPDQLKKQGFNGLITVGKGSSSTPRMVTLTYSGAKQKSPGGKYHLVLVGKGITFDTGGISLKPPSGMWEMKSDMAGAATALTAMLVIAGLKLKVKVSAVLTLAENRPGHAAVLPGDIFTAKNGKTIMVDNTDAEGRLILTDGLAQAGIIGATHIVDIATLTGSIVRAIGPCMAGLFSNNAALAKRLKNIGKSVGEKFWEMPLEPEYRSYLDDPVADMKNIGKVEAGSITAALFLKEFVPDRTPWLHFDIAGTAFTTKQWKYFSEGATGFGVKTLVAMAKSMANG
ncbi:M17 family metallopeptidase [Fibrobacterota bacterium]